MMFQWTPDMIRFMKTASEYGTYHQELVRLMMPQLNSGTHICDAGCGLGHLSLALAPYVRRVTAVDANGDALRVLREQLREQRCGNVEIRQGDLFHMQPKEPYDSMAFCFFGNIQEILRAAKQQCRGTIFAFKRNYRMHRFSTGSYGVENDSWQNACAYLDARGIPYVGQTLTLEFGQPFVSFADAKLFFETYNRSETPVTDAFVQKRIAETGREDFPLYMPHQRDMGFLRLEAGDIPEEYRTEKENIK